MRHPGDMELIELAGGRHAEDSPLGRHLRTCAECWSRYEQIRRTHAALGRWEAPLATADLWPVIEGRLDAARAKHGAAARIRSAVLLRVAAAVLLGLGLGHGAARIWNPVPRATLGPDQDVDAVLGLDVLAQPSPLGFALLLEDLDGATASEDTP